jgi:thiamine-monophosphate kinase
MKKDHKLRGINGLPERELIRQIMGMSAGKRFPQLKTGIGDDAAVLQVPRGHEIVVTTDFCLEGTHFRRDWHSAESAGHRCLARGLSDLAAMGAKPLAAFLSLAIPAGTPRPWIDGFFRGLLALAREHNVPLAGGDLARSPGQGKSAGVLADIVLVGSVPMGRVLLRSTAKPGDLIYVTGALGGAAAELAKLSNVMKQTRVPHSKDGFIVLRVGRMNAEDQPHLFPQPRIAAGIALQKRRSRIPCMDISDGLAMDLDRLCEASGVAAELDAAQIPLATGATLEQALHGGEDYELLFCAPASAKIPRRLGGVAVTRIGRIVPKQRRQRRLTLISPDGRRGPLVARGWEYEF